jgi:hypothetical protein
MVTLAELVFVVVEITWSTPVHEPKSYPLAALAVSVTLVPAVYCVRLGLLVTVPAPEGLTAVLKV